MTGEAELPPIINAEKLSTWELCARRAVWQERYVNLRVSLIRALYMALDAGLCTDKDPEKAAENQFLSLARDPGLDILGSDVFAIAVHYSKLAGILALSLRSAFAKPWEHVGMAPLPKGIAWKSSLYIAEAKLRRIVLVDHWSDDRRMEERWNWYTVGEVCALNIPFLLHAITIGKSQEKRRYSPWTRCTQAPHTNVFRFKRKKSTEGFAPSWREAWREDCDIPTEHWLTRMREDGCMTDLVHTLEIPKLPSKDAYLKEMVRMAREIERAPELPNMRLKGCFGFAPCPFRFVCHDELNPPEPELFGFMRRAECLSTEVMENQISLAP